MVNENEQKLKCELCIQQRKLEGIINPTDPDLCIDCSNKISDKWHGFMKANMNEEDRKAEARVAKWNAILALFGL